MGSATLALHDALTMLVGRYAAVVPPSDSGRQRFDPLWPAINGRAVQGSLTADDWDEIRRLCRPLIAHGEALREPWFQTVVLFMGGQSHEMVAQLGGRREIAMPMCPSPVRLMDVVDLIRSAALFCSYALAEDDFAMAEGLRQYLTIEPELRTHFTDTLLVTEQVISNLLTLHAGGVADLRRRFVSDPIWTFLEVAFNDLKDLLLEHETLTSILYNSILNLLYEQDRTVHLFRVHTNMTTINEKDPTNFHGDVFLRVVKQWFQEKFGVIHVAQNPERTTFEFTAISPNRVREALADFVTEIRMRLQTTAGVDPAIVGRFTPRLVVAEGQIGRGDLFAYAVRTDEELEAFRPVLEFETGLDVDALRGLKPEVLRERLSGFQPRFDSILRSRDQALSKILSALILNALVEFNGVLAGRTSFFEKESARLPGRGGRSSGVDIYEERDLPQKGTAADAVLKEYLRRKPGYVGPGQYDPALHDPRLAGAALPFFRRAVGAIATWDGPTVHPLVSLLLNGIPRLRHLKGRLSHRRDDSQGLLEDYCMNLQRLLGCPEGEIPAALQAFHETLRALRDAFRSLYSAAAVDPRNAWTPKQHRSFQVHRGDATVPVTSNFFLQEVARTGNTFLAEMEYDSFRAFSERFGVKDLFDSQFHRVRAAIFVAAHEMNMEPPVVDPSGGDHIAFSFGSRDRNGADIDPVRFCRRIQEIVRDDFAAQRFHDLHKVEMREWTIKTAEKAAAAAVIGSDDVAREIVSALRLSAVPYPEKVTTDGLTLFVPAVDRHGRPVDPERFMEVVRKYLPDAQKIGVSQAEIKRLPIWTRDGAQEGEDGYWLFSRRPVDGYSIFYKTLTVTIALGSHPPIRHRQDVMGFPRIEEIVQRALDEAKRKFWPHKGGFVDVRHLTAGRRRSTGRMILKATLKG